MLAQLMKIYETIKCIELSDSARKRNEMKDKEEQEENDGTSGDDDTALIHDDHNRLIRLYHVQRQLTLNMGLTSDQIMIAAMHSMKKVCANLPYETTPVSCVDLYIQTLFFAVVCPCVLLVCCWANTHTVALQY